MSESTENIHDQKSSFSEKEQFLLRVSSITDLNVPPMILDQLFPILGEGELPADFRQNPLMHDPSVVSYFMKKLYEKPEYADCVFDGVDGVFSLLSKEYMYEILSELTPMVKFDEIEMEEWKHAYASHLLMYILITENEFFQLRYLIPLMLIHDIGKQVLHLLEPEICDNTVSLARKMMIPRSIAEKDHLNLTHAEVGARLLKEWNFPDKVTKPILYHHSTNIPEEYILETALVQFVNWLDCHVRGIPAKPLNQKTMEAAGIEEIDIDYWMKRHKRIVEETDRFFNAERDMNSN